MNLRPALALVLCSGLVLGGCGVGTLLTVIDQLNILDKLTGSGGENDVAKAVQALSGSWRVVSYSGDDVGVVVVPADADMTWNQRSDMTFAVQSRQPVPIGHDTTRRYDESGQWRIDKVATKTLGLILSVRAGMDVPIAERIEATCTYARTGRNQITLTTYAIGPGVVSYVLQR